MTAWNDDLLHDPHAVVDKRTRVQRMFAAIAPKYDLNNRLHSFGLDQRWRRKAVKLALVAPAENIVDVACGTGDLTLQMVREARQTSNAAFLKWVFRKMDQGRRRYPTDALGDPVVPRVIGVDYTFPMLDFARRKPRPIELKMKDGHSDNDLDLATDYEDLPNGILWLNADATALPLADASADVVSIAFGIRNVQEPAKAMAEFFRVLRPGGRVIILEFSQPKNRVIRFFNDLYCKRIMPHTATWLSGDTSGAYKYLPMSVETFVTREGMMQMMREVGFVEVTQHPMTFGVAVVYRGYKRG